MSTPLERVVFLDVDGVLHPADAVESSAPTELFLADCMDTCNLAMAQHCGKHGDRVKDRLRRIVVSTGAAIVL
eukprot:4777510-Amphidinium_carterae.1